MTLQKLFSYGTLQNKDVQIATFSRELNGYSDAVIGYKIELMKIDDPEIVKLSGKKYHPILVKSENGSVDGMVFEVSEEELNKCDIYEKQYKRILVPLKSGDNAFVYVPKETSPFIHFRNISFQYEGSNNHAIHSLDLQIPRGQKVGIVGHSGAGKSTLVNLLLKNFAISNYQYWEKPAIEAVQNPQGGDILIAGQSIYDVSSDSLRSQISLIPQDIMLFHRTIGENIAYAKENATQNEIENASKMAMLHEFIIGLPDGYSTLVGERGIKLSGGQRQRIAIARAILKNVPILILDEATSSLDSGTETEIQKSINAMLEQNNATVIAIAHRLSTIKHMDRIVVMDGGEIVEDGSFAELISKEKGKFKELWEHQVNGMVV